MNEIYGAIIGDIAGSKFEVEEIRAYLNKEKVSREKRLKNAQEDFFTRDKEFTDDTILTIAVMDAILNGGDYSKYLKEYTDRFVAKGNDRWGRGYFSPNYVKIMKGEVKPESKGNGSCMRVSPVAYAFDNIEETLINAKFSAYPSHNSYDGTLCAQATAGCVYLARKKANKELIKRFTEDILSIKLNYDLEELQNKNKFSALAIETCPVAIYLFLISQSYEDCLRKSISIGGDVDSICAVSCAIAGAFYGVSDVFVKKAKDYLPKDFIKVIEAFQKKYGC